LKLGRPETGCVSDRFESSATGFSKFPAAAPGAPDNTYHASGPCRHGSRDDHHARSSVEVRRTETAISLLSDDHASEDEKDNPLVLTVPWNKARHRRHRDVIGGRVVSALAPAQPSAVEKAIRSRARPGIIPRAMGSSVLSSLNQGRSGMQMYGFQPLYFLQTPNEVVMLYEHDHQVRHVYLDVPHSAGRRMPVGEGLAGSSSGC
jgi:hypothetical protein